MTVQIAGCVFVADTKIIFGYNLVAPLKSNSSKVLISNVAWRNNEHHKIAPEISRKLKNLLQKGNIFSIDHGNSRTKRYLNVSQLYLKNKQSAKFLPDNFVESISSIIQWSISSVIQFLITGCTASYKIDLLMEEGNPVICSGRYFVETLITGKSTNRDFLCLDKFTEEKMVSLLLL